MRSQDEAASAAGPNKSVPPPEARRRPVKYYKKAPDAPKRFKSAFIFFSTAKHREIRDDLRKKGENTKTTNVAKLVSEEWKKLSSEDRQEWEEMARQDKIRFEKEKALYSGPWKVQTTNRGRKKDPDAPKRPSSAFLKYSNSKRAGLKREDPSLSNADVSKILSKMWKEAPQELKQPYIDEEFKLRQEYKVASAEWRAASAKKIKKVERKLRENTAETVVAPQPESPPPTKRRQAEPASSSGIGDDLAADVALQHPGLSARMRQHQSLFAAAPPPSMGVLPSTFGQANNPLLPYANYNIGTNLSLTVARQTAAIGSLPSPFGGMLPLTLGALSNGLLPSMYDATRLATLQRLQQQEALLHQAAGGEEFSNPLFLMGYNGLLPTDEPYLPGRSQGMPPPS